MLQLTLKKWSSLLNLFSALITLLPPTDPVLCEGMPPGWVAPSATSVATCAAAWAMLSGGLSEASMTETDRLEPSERLNTYTD